MKQDAVVCDLLGEEGVPVSHRKLFWRKMRWRLYSLVKFLYGVTIKYLGGGGGLECWPGHFYLFHKGDGKLYFFTSG